MSSESVFQSGAPKPDPSAESDEVLAARFAQSRAEERRFLNMLTDARVLIKKLNAENEHLRQQLMRRPAAVTIGTFSFLFFLSLLTIVAGTLGFIAAFELTDTYTKVLYAVVSVIALAAGIGMGYMLERLRIR